MYFSYISVYISWDLGVSEGERTACPLMVTAAIALGVEWSGVYEDVCIQPVERYTQWATAAFASRVRPFCSRAYK